MSASEPCGQVFTASIATFYCHILYNSRCDGNAATVSSRCCGIFESDTVWVSTTWTSLAPSLVPLPPTVLPSRLPRQGGRANCRVNDMGRRYVERTEQGHPRLALAALCPPPGPEPVTWMTWSNPAPTWAGLAPTG